MTARIGLIGDLHGSWDDEDVRAFNACEYDLLIFTGDLGSGTAKNGVSVAKSISALTKPSLVMPGNNDVPFLAEIAAEFGHQRGLAAILDLGADPDRRRARVRLTGYERHVYEIRSHEFTVVTGRPFAMGGGELSFEDALARDYGVRSMDESTERLISLVDEVTTERLLILGHNGPFGLGGKPTDLWGRDFSPEHGDWGDPDLDAAVSRAVVRGHELIVVAGHMHQRVAGGGQREWFVRRDDVDFVNPARVPRIYAGSESELRYHVTLDIGAEGFQVTEVEWQNA
ncbi:MAG: metallophosphoesterase [Myxococcota bacterium]